ncbi:four-carbon acid sugar kinase family protein [Stackebrandtia nassauensis]|uniref:Type III effector Hrp-dependent outers n=1 Tax=Stackebrandtia nassauensis (strain DSM 44728 / CIP 108903 / NRRL B-16338 / NBRC 102104 / LLR-40K-21) TaxID=446470 RepID=D3QBQ1_STANL|nr:four-carbon acid sugar kinase family protein [Stackebrandtia nassauensis]ADD42933.1 type III effector Hrp-dependent outers [Stackebrandtia nassauensis DSM 44728]
MTPPHAILVIADDLTGANATAAGFARAGLRAVTVGADQPGTVIAEFTNRFDAVVVCTDTRHAPPAEAAARVEAAIAAAPPVRLVCNRVDSTLRGNLGASTAAVLRAVARRTATPTVALFLPAHPAAGRQTVEGNQLLDGVRLENTELARDPRTPLRTSDVADLLTQQAALRIAHIPLSLVTGDPVRLRKAVATRVAAGAQVIIGDALTVEHLRRVTDAAVAAAPEVEWVGVDPGPGAVELARAKGLTGHDDTAPLLAVSGSATALTRQQLARLRETRPVTVVRPVYSGDTVLPDLEPTAKQLAAALAQADSGDTVLLATALDDGDIVDIDPADAARLPQLLAGAVRRALAERAVGGLFVTGGDVTAAMTAELGAAGIEVEQELVPLAVAGSVVGGDWDGLPIVTKGGLVGDPATTVECVDHLRRTVQANRRRVRAAAVGHHDHTTGRTEPGGSS